MTQVSALSCLLTTDWDRSVPLNDGEQSSKFLSPTLAAGDWSVDSEGDGEGSSGDLHDGVSESDNNN